MQDGKTVITPREALGHIAKAFLVQLQGILPGVNLTGGSESVSAAASASASAAFAFTGVAAVVSGVPAYFAHGRIAELVKVLPLAGLPAACLADTAEEPVLAWLGALRSRAGSTLRKGVDELMAKLEPGADASADASAEAGAEAGAKAAKWYVIVLDVGGGTTDYAVIEGSRCPISACRVLTVVDTGGMDDLAGKDFKDELRQLLLKDGAMDKAAAIEAVLEGALAELR